MKLRILIVFLLFPGKWLFAQEAGIHSKDDRHGLNVGIPEVQELLFIAYSISEKGLQDTLILNRKTDYYHRVLKQFMTFRNDACVKSIGIDFGKHFHQLRMDACNYHFSAEGKLVKNAGLNNLSWGRKDHLKKYLPHLEEFAARSLFRDFYHQNQNYYKSLIDTLADRSQPLIQKSWLEARSQIKYEKFSIYFSPLSWGRHSTNSYESGNGPSLAIFVSAPYMNPEVPEWLLKVYDTRMIFTELDHNYVNPASIFFSDEIKECFRDRGRWATGEFTDGYPDPQSLFNEYMTWALFLVYARERYSETEFTMIRARVENSMMNYRGFIRFGQFSKALLERCQANPETLRISDMCREMLMWCRE